MRKVALIIVAVLVAGCGSTTTPTPIIILVTPTPSVAPTATALTAPTSTPPLATSSPSPTPAAVVDLPKLTRTVPGASKTKYYDVVGNSPQELGLGMATHCSSAGFVCVDTGGEWNITSTTRGSSCTITKASTKYSPTAILPRWSGPSKVYPELLTWWQEQVLAHIVSSDAQLIKIVKAQNKRFPKLLLGKPCSQRQATINKWERARTKAINAFYAKEQAWAPSPYTGP